MIDAQTIQIFTTLVLPLFNCLQQALALLDVGIKLVNFGLGLVFGGPKPLHHLLQLPQLPLLLLQFLLPLPQSIASGMELGRATLFNLSNLSIQAIADQVPIRHRTSRQIGTFTLFFRGQLLFRANFLAKLYGLIKTTFVLYQSQFSSLDHQHSSKCTYRRLFFVGRRLLDIRLL